MYFTLHLIKKMTSQLFYLHAKGNFFLALCECFLWFLWSSLCMCIENITSVIPRFSVKKCNAWAFMCLTNPQSVYQSNALGVCIKASPGYCFFIIQTQMSPFFTCTSSYQDLWSLIAYSLRMHLISSPLAISKRPHSWMLQNNSELCVHALFCVCACVFMHLCCMCVCVSLVSAAVQECRSESMMANTHHILNQTNPSSLLSCLKSLSLSHRTINTFASPQICFPALFFFISRRKKMFATSSRLCDVALYFVHSCRPHNSGRWILKHSQGPAREGRFEVLMTRWGLNKAPLWAG